MVKSYLPEKHKKKHMFLHDVAHLLQTYALVNSEDPDEMLCNMQSFIRVCIVDKRRKQYSGTIIYQNLEISNCDPFNYKMDKTMLTVSIFMEKYIRMKRVK